MFWAVTVKIEFLLVGLVGWLIGVVVRFKDIVGKPEEREEI